MIDAEIARYFEEATKSQLDQASIQLAQVSRLESKGILPRRARQDIVAAMIARAKREHPEWSIERICRFLDASRCPVRTRDKTQGFSTWHDLWKDPKHRNRIKRFTSEIRPAAPEKKI